MRTGTSRRVSRIESRLVLEHDLDEIHYRPSHHTVHQECEGCRSHFCLDEVVRLEVVWSLYQIALGVSFSSIP